MGYPANLVIVDRDGWQLYTCPSRARALDTDLAAGPEAAIRTVRGLNETQEWYDESTCEGAVLIDIPRRVLLFGTNQLADFAHRAALLAVLARTWRGWHVQWAFGGLGDLAEYVGLDRSVVRDRSNVLSDHLMVPEDDEIDQLVTVRRADGREDAYAFYEDIYDALKYGPEMVELLPDEARVSTCRFPRSGLHIDLGKAELGVWSMDPLTAIEDWPGWRIEFWADRYEEQLSRCAVRVEDWDFQAGLETLTQRLDEVAPADRARVRDVIERLRGSR